MCGRQTELLIAITYYNVSIWYRIVSDTSGREGFDTPYTSWYHEEYSNHLQSGKFLLLES